jgi:hypothetical protein
MSGRKPKGPERTSVQLPEADPEQYQRFLDAARDLGCDDDEGAFERRFAEVAPARRPGEVAPSQAEAKARAKAPKRPRREP